MADAAATALSSNRVNRRLTFVRWVRRTHGWFGLWGALLGLMAGTSGIWLNHRSVMKLELPDQQQTNTQLAIPDPRPETANAMATWLQQTLKVDRPEGEICRFGREADPCVAFALRSFRCLALRDIPMADDRTTRFAAQWQD